MLKRILILGLLMACLCSCQSANSHETSVADETTSYDSNILPTSSITKIPNTSSATSQLTEDSMILISINGTKLDVTFENNGSVDALYNLVKNGLLTSITANQYGGFEQVAPLGISIESSDEYIKANPGDIMLYSSSNIVFFYGSNSWSYTKLGHINMDIDKLRTILNRDSVKIEFSIIDK